MATIPITSDLTDELKVLKDKSAGFLKAKVLYGPFHNGLDLENAFCLPPPYCEWPVPAAPTCPYPALLLENLPMVVLPVGMRKYWGTFWLTS